MQPAAVQSWVIEPGMDGIGDRWQLAEINVADEHLATAISYAVLARLFPRLVSAPPRSRERVILAAVQGEHHVLGLRMVADVLEGAGFDVLYLGADVPNDALLSACETHRPAVLGLSVTMVLNVASVISLLADLQVMDGRPAVLVGGSAMAAMIERGLRVVQVEHSEGVVAVVEAVLERPPAGPLVPEDLLPRDAVSARGKRGRGAEIGAIAGAFSAPALAAADATGRAFELEQMADHDPLTGVWNRRAYEDRLHRVVEDGETQFAVLILDVDCFRAINDRYGFAAGDVALRAVARSITERVSPADFVARVGGDEFAVLQADASSSLAVALAELLRNGVERELTNPPVTVSVGVTLFSSSVRATSLAAQQALFEAKQTGPNRVALQEPR
jgi:diguanylate cyclase (GGDEF)-like protein